MPGVLSSGVPMRLLAFADESMRNLGGGTWVYMLAAAIVPENGCERIRDALRPLVRKGQGQLHWRDEDLGRRRAITKTLVTLDVDSVVVLGVVINSRKQERARRKLLGRLLWELDQRSVSLLTLESRHRERDRHDIKAVGAFRNQHVVSRRLIVVHGQPVQEPLLWIPDAVAGAVGDAWCGQPACLRMLGDLAEVLDDGTVG